MIRPDRTAVLPPPEDPAPVAAAAPSGARRHRLDSLVSVAAGSGVYALSIVTGPLLARTLGPASRGDLQSVLVPAQLLVWVLAFGVPLASAYHVRRFPARDLMTTAWVLALAVGLPAGLAVWLLAPGYLADHDPVTVGWLRTALVVGLVATPAATCLELLRARAGAGVSFNVLRSLGPVLNALALVVLALLDRLDLPSALAAGVLSNAVQYVVVLVLLRGRPGRRLERQASRAQLHYGARAALGDVSGLVVARLDQVLMVTLVSSSALGLYAVAATAAMVSTPMAQGLSAALFPHLLSGSEQDRALRIRTGTTWTLVASLLASGLLAVTAPVLVPFAFGEAFAGAVLALWLMLPGQVCANLATVRMSVLQAQGRPGWASASSGVAALVTVVGVVPAIALFGIEGAAALTSLSQAAQLLLLVVVGRSTSRAAR